MARFRALLVGVADYSDRSIPSLPFVTNDINELRSALESRGYEAVAYDDPAPSRNAIAAEVQEMIDSADHGDTLLICLSGHGVHHGGKDYIVPADARLRQQKFTEACVPVGEWVISIEHTRATNVLVLVDACREGFAELQMGFEERRRWSTQLIDGIDRRNVAYVFSCSAGQTAGYVTSESESFSLFSRAVRKVVSNDADLVTLAGFEQALTRQLDGIVRFYGKNPQRVRIQTDADGEEFVVFPRNLRQATPPGAEPVVDSELEELFIDGLDAFYTERWGRAIDTFDQLIARQPDYRDAADKRDQASRSQQLADLFTNATANAQTGEWDKAITQLEELLQVEPGYPGAQELLRKARHERTQRRLKRLQNEAHLLHGASRWAAVVALAERFKALDPQANDLDDVVEKAKQELDKAETNRTLEDSYRRATRHYQAWSSGQPIGALRQAHQALRTIQGINPSYRETRQLAAKVRFELAKAGEPVGRPDKLRDVTAPKPITAVALSPTGDRLAVACEGKTVHVFDMYTGERRLSTPRGALRADANHLVFSPDGARLAIAGGDGIARIWDAADGSELLRLPHSGTLLSVAFSPDGGKLATASNNGTARIWNAASGNQLGEVDHDNDGQLTEIYRGKRFMSVHGLAFSPDGRWLATASDYHTARIWRVADGQVILRVQHGKPVFAVAFSPNGRQLATASQDSTACVWDITTGNKLLKVDHNDEVRGVSFSLDGLWLVTASCDHTAKVWDASSGQELLPARHGERLTGVAFSADGLRFATSTEGKDTSQIWQIVEPFET